MISSKDRSGWFGASDTDFIIGNWETATFEKWWLTKLGINNTDFQNQYLLAGTHKEHQILNSLQIPLMEMDKQILIPELRLRVNLDGNTSDCIFECKTYSAEKPFKTPIKYKRQVWVQMFASEIRQAKIVAYGLGDEDYKNFFLPIDKDRLSVIDIPYNEPFIKDEYLPKLEYLAQCLEKGKFPISEERTIKK